MYKSQKLLSVDVMIGHSIILSSYITFGFVHPSVALFAETHLSHSRGWTPYHRGRFSKCDNLLFWKGAVSAYLRVGNRNDITVEARSLLRFDIH